MSNPKEHLKKVAKRLHRSHLRALGQEGTEAVPGNNPKTLMQFQHRVAEIYGFESWDAVNHSTPEQVQKAIDSTLGIGAQREKVIVVLGYSDTAAILQITEGLKKHVDYSSFGSIVDFLDAPNKHGTFVWEGIIHEDGFPAGGRFEGKWRRPTPEEMESLPLKSTDRRCHSLVEVFEKIQIARKQHPEGYIVFKQKPEQLSLGYAVVTDTPYGNGLVLAYCYVRITALRDVPETVRNSLRTPEGRQEIAQKLETGQRFWV